MLRRGAFAFLARRAASLLGGVAFDQDLDEIVPVRAIGILGGFDNRDDHFPQRAICCLAMIVTGGRADATARYDLGAGASLQERFLYYRAPDDTILTLYGVPAQRQRSMCVVLKITSKPARHPCNGTLQ